MGLSLTVLGCGKKETSVTTVDSSSASAATGSASTVAHAPKPEVAPPAAPIIAGNATADAAAEQMTLELRKYVAYSRTIPKSFDDFVAHHPMNFPVAPAGKKYVIDGARVVVR